MAKPAGVPLSVSDQFGYFGQGSLHKRRDHLRNAVPMLDGFAGSMERLIMMILISPL